MILLIPAVLQGLVTAATYIWNNANNISNITDAFKAITSSTSSEKTKTDNEARNRQQRREAAIAKIEAALNAYEEKKEIQPDAKELKELEKDLDNFEEAHFGQVVSTQIGIDAGKDLVGEDRYEVSLEKLDSVKENLKSSDHPVDHNALDTGIKNIKTKISRLKNMTEDQKNSINRRLNHIKVTAQSIRQDQNTNQPGPKPQ